MTLRNGSCCLLPAGPRADGPVRDSRPSLYALRLLVLDIAVLDADFESGRNGECREWIGEDLPAIAPAQRQALALAALAEVPEIDPDRVAVSGLGQGARAIVTAEGESRPRDVALLYPGCDAALAEAVQGAGPPALLLQATPIRRTSPRPAPRWSPLPSRAASRSLCCAARAMAGI